MRDIKKRLEALENKNKVQLETYTFYYKDGTVKTVNGGIALSVVIDDYELIKRIEPYNSLFYAFIGGNEK